MFPGTELSVYVPPSNVLSDEGREMIVKEFPEIRTIASNYFVGDMAYTQEFEVAEDWNCGTTPYYFRCCD